MTLVQDRLICSLVEKLSYTPMGGPMAGYLGQEQVLQVEAGIASKVEHIKRGRQRAKLTDPRGISGRDLIAKP